MSRILNSLKKLLGERRYNESILKSGRYVVICISLPDRVMTIKDKQTNHIIEVSIRNVDSGNWCLSCNCKCCKCESGECDHILFAIYSPYISVLRDLYFENDIQILQLPHRIYEMISNRLSFDLIRLIPMIGWLIIGMGLIPMTYDPTIDSYRIFLSGLLGLNPLVNTGVPI